MGGSIEMSEYWVFARMFPNISNLNEFVLMLQNNPENLTVQPLEAFTKKDLNGEIEIFGRKHNIEENGKDRLIVIEMRKRDEA